MRRNQPKLLLIFFKEQQIINDASTYAHFEEKTCVVNTLVDSSVEIDDVIKNSLAPTFLESLIEFDSTSVFVTQFEVYYRNDEAIDASAIPTLYEPYQNVPVAVIKEKNEKRNTWFELSIFYKRYEMLVTGGIINEISSKQLSPFLGTSIPFPNLMSSNRKTKTFFVAQNKTDFLVRERNLRNRIKHSSSFQWAVVSKRFKEKGFFTINSLEITNSPNKKVNLISFTLNCICKDTYTIHDHRKMLALLAEISFPQVPQKTHIKKIASLRKKNFKHAPNHDLSVLDVLVKLEKNIGKPPRSVLAAEAAVVLFSKLNPYYKSMNKKALDFYKF